MMPAGLVEEIKKLTVAERLTIMEVTLQLVREDLGQLEPPSRAERKRRLIAAAQALLPDYAPGGELTVFTTLDGEDFHA
ncbi:MAG: hypothetical protein KKA73_24200 [Chloroflexi bacterium]|nr:hypothetical protein [Chloroflexota bacterium]MBU1750795.1 hypothetical protein [Chloroflexota bacterium]